MSRRCDAHSRFAIRDDVSSSVGQGIPAISFLFSLNYKTISKDEEKVLIPRHPSKPATASSSSRFPVQMAVNNGGSSHAESRSCHVPANSGRKNLCVRALLL